MLRNDLKPLQHINPPPHLLAPADLPACPDVLQAGGEAGEGEATQQHHEDPADVGNAQAGSLATIPLLLNISCQD